METIAYVAALLAAVNVGAVSITYARLTRLTLRVSYLASNVKRLQSSSEELGKKVGESATAKIGAEVAELSDAVDSLRQTHQRFAGKVWSVLRPPHGDASSADSSTPEQVRARLREQLPIPRIGARE